MSQENVEIVLTAVDAVNRADVDAFVSCFHPDVQWEVTANDSLASTGLIVATRECGAG